MRRPFQHFRISGFQFLIFCLPFAWLWFVLINQLRVEWTLNPQYGYGWAVPFLCAYLIWQNLAENAEKLKAEKLKKSSASKFPYFRFSIFSFLLLAFLYFPTRLVEEANPGWRLISWALAIEVIGLTLLAIYFLARVPELQFSAFRFSAFVFPVLFFLVAVPWPTMIESPLIQGLTRADTGATTELFNWLGIPAMPHGNVIEVATGQVGIDEACSGIRSFQATLMISLFLGEFYRLNVARRFGLIFGGFAMSFVFNLARMSILVWVAAHQGVAAISKWHDPTGVTILLACFCGLWAMGVLLKNKKQKTEIKNAGTLKTETLKKDGRPGISDFGISAFQPFSLSVFLIVWILLTEISIAAWYDFHEARLPAAPQWTVAWPTNNSTFKNLPLPARTRQILRYDEGSSASWQENQIGWQAVFLRWNPGQTALHLAQNHTPEVCLAAAGHTLKSISGLQWFDVNGLRLPFLAYQVTDTPGSWFVFYCLWDDRAATQGFGTMSLNYGNRLAPVLAGLRNPGQRSLEIAVGGVTGAVEAEATVRDELEKLVRAAK